MSIMKCPEKDSLQHKCTAGWNAYLEAARESGFPIDPAGQLRPPAISEMGASLPPIDLARSVNATALHLRGEHLKASWDLSVHLSKHRC